MKLRVVTATRGTSPFWAETLASLATAVPEAEHVVVGPAAKEAELTAGRTGVRFAADAGGGLYAALNQGLRAGETAWDAFTWLNDDDLLLAPGFHRLREKMRSVEVEIGYGRVMLIDRKSTRLGALPVARHARDLPALLARGIVPLAQPGTIIRRKVWETLGGFDERYQLAGDLDFFVRALQTGTR